MPNAGLRDGLVSDGRLTWRLYKLTGHWTGLIFSCLPYILLSSSVSLSYFYVAVPICGCLGKHSCTSYPFHYFPIAILHGTCSLWAPILFCGELWCACYQKLNYKQKMPNAVWCWLGYWCLMTIVLIIFFSFDFLGISRSDKSCYCSHWYSSNTVKKKKTLTGNMQLCCEQAIISQGIIRYIN